VPFVNKYFGALAKKYQIDDRLLEGLAEMGFKKPTPVQMQTIPSLL
jgi:superfamily II DNA/RNA helicase